MAKKELKDLSWAEIAEISRSGKAAEHFEVGDTKTVELFTGEAVELVIVGLDHDEAQDFKGKAGITFGTKNLLDQMYYMNNEYTNEGGWGKSFMRNVNMPRIDKLLPQELREVICPVVKLTQGNGLGDRLFLFSESEVYGTKDDRYRENEQYPYFEDSKNRVKVTNSGNDYWWWLRSPLSTFTTFFRFVISNGNLSFNIASIAIGLCLGFCV